MAKGIKVCLDMIKERNKNKIEIVVYTSLRGRQAKALCQRVRRGLARECTVSSALGLVDDEEVIYPCLSLLFHSADMLL